MHPSYHDNKPIMIVAAKLLWIIFWSVLPIWLILNVTAFAVLLLPIAMLGVF